MRVRKLEGEEQRPPQKQQKDVNLSSHSDHESLQAGQVKNTWAFILNGHGANYRCLW